MGNALYFFAQKKMENWKKFLAKWENFPLLIFNIVWEGLEKIKKSPEVKLCIKHKIRIMATHSPIR
jgi:hypothetical protein